MKFRFLMLGAACVLCTEAGAVTTGNLDGIVSAGYTYTSISSIDFNTYDIGGVAKYRFNDSGFNLQGAFNYSNIDIEGLSINDYKGGGALFYRNDMGALGAFGEYNRYEAYGSGIDFYTYGLAAEWFATAKITARAHFAGLSFEDASGAYGGVGASYYVIPDLSLNLDGSYNNIADMHWYDVKVGAEYLISQQYPVSLGVSYVYTKYTGLSSNSNGVMVRLSWHMGDSGSLVDLDRSGPLNTQQPNFLPI
jgi:hypothetical protein